MKTKCRSFVASLLFLVMGIARAQSADGELVGFSKRVYDLRVVGKRRALSADELAAQAKWIKEHPLGPGQEHEVADAEYYLDCLEPGQPPRKIWSDRVRTKVLPREASVIFPFGRSGFELLDFHYDREQAVCVVVFCRFGFILADTMSGALGGTLGKPNPAYLMAEEDGNDGRLVGSEAIFDKHKKGVSLVLKFAGGTRCTFRFDGQTWVYEVPPALPDKSPEPKLKP